MISFKVTGVNIQADVNQEDLTSVTLHTLVSSDRVTGSAEELEQIARAVGVISNTDLEPGYEVDLTPFGYTVEDMEIDSTLSYEDHDDYQRTRQLLKRQELRNVPVIEAIKTLEGPEGRGEAMAVRDWLIEVLQ